MQNLLWLLDGHMGLLAGVDGRRTYNVPRPISSTSPTFVLLNYGAVGVITIGKFIVQRGLLTGTIRLARRAHPQPLEAPRVLTRLASRPVQAPGAIADSTPWAR